MSVAVGGRRRHRSRSRSRSKSKALKDCRKDRKVRGLGHRRLGKLVSDLKESYPEQYALLAAKGRVPRVDAKGRAEKALASKNAARKLAASHRNKVSAAHKKGAGKNAYIKACDTANKRVLDAVKAAGINRRFKYKGNTYEVQAGLPKRVAGRSLSDNKYSNAADLLKARQRNMKAAVAKKKGKGAPKKAAKRQMSAAEKAAAAKKRQARLLKRLAGGRRSRSGRKRSGHRRSSGRRSRSGRRR